MKKHQLAAMILSALSTGVLISCSKPNDDMQNTVADSESKAKPASDASNSKTTQVQAIDIAPDTAAQYAKHVTDTQILTAYQDVVAQSQKLNELATKQCALNTTIEAAELQQLQEQWLNLAKAWARAEIINFGPAMDSMSNLYINYYPDERGLVHQGVIDLIEANPSLTAEQLASESAIVQGIPGLEEVLYSNETLTDQQCQYVRSASEALTARLENVLEAWKENPESLMGMEEGSRKTGMNYWVNSILSLVETTKSSSLDQPLGITGNKKGHLPAQAAGQSREIITAKVAALNKALTDVQLVTILNEGGQDGIANELSTVLSETSSLLAEMPEDIATDTPENQKALYDKLTELTQLIKHQLMPALGVQVGFNSTDGD